MMRSSDFGGLLRTLAADKRTVRLLAEGEGICMWIDVVDGRIVRADDMGESAWPLGDLLVHLSFIRARHIPRILAQSEKEKKPPEAVVLSKELVSLALLKRFRERLTLQNLLTLGLSDSFRAELKPMKQEELEAKEWDVEIPIPFALRSINKGLEDRLGWEGSMPAPGARFEQRRAALHRMLEAQTQQSQEDGALDWTPEVRRIFFLCNGRTPFSVFPMIVGQSPEQVAGHLDEMLERGLVDPATRPVSRMDVRERLSGAMRLVSSFGAGLVSVALLVTLLVQFSAWSKGELEALPPRSMQEAHIQSRPVAIQNVDSALAVYKRLEDRFPESLKQLRLVTGIRGSMLRLSVHGADIEYAVDPSGLSYRLFREVKPVDVPNNSGE